MSEKYQKIEETKNFLKKISPIKPMFGVILGTGLGNLVNNINIDATCEYKNIPNFVESTVDSHNGKLIFGMLGNVPVVAMEGRFHYYEGYTLDQITFPVRVIKALGAEGLIVTNACGGLNPLHKKGDIMLIEDHINLMGVNPLIGKNDDKLGIRFPDMSMPYNKEYIERIEKIALENNVKLQQGVYAAMTGPSLETRAEYRMLRLMGADAIGMSTVPEVIVAVHAGLKVLGLSVLTDLCLPDTLQPVKLEEIIAVSQKTAPILEKIICEFIASF